MSVHANRGYRSHNISYKDMGLQTTWLWSHLYRMIFLCYSKLSGVSPSCSSRWQQRYIVRCISWEGFSKVCLTMTVTCSLETALITVLAAIPAAAATFSLVFTCFWRLYHWLRYWLYCFLFLMKSVEDPHNLKEVILDLWAVNVSLDVKSVTHSNTNPSTSP